MCVWYVSSKQGDNIMENDKESQNVAIPIVSKLLSGHV